MLGAAADDCVCTNLLSALCRSKPWLNKGCWRLLRAQSCTTSQQGEGRLVEGDVPAWRVPVGRLIAGSTHEREAA